MAAYLDAIAPFVPAPSHRLVPALAGDLHLWSCVAFAYPSPEPNNRHLVVLVLLRFAPVGLASALGDFVQ